MPVCRFGIERVPAGSPAQGRLLIVLSFAWRGTSPGADARARDSFPEIKQVTPRKGVGGHGVIKSNDPTIYVWAAVFSKRPKKLTRSMTR
jgi:hypothetical protein